MQAAAPWLLDFAYAHRGLWGGKYGPENSLSAFEAARSFGLGVELDVRLSADGEAVVFHDDTLDRMTSARGYTSSRTAAELSRLRLRGSDEGIPTLGEALEALADAPVLVELKVNRGSEGPLERRVGYVMAHHQGPCAVMSFNRDTLAELAEMSPHLPRGLLTSGWRTGRAPLMPWNRRAGIRRFVEAQRVRPDFLACDIAALATFGRPAADEMHVPLLGWTVRNRSQLDRAERNADALIFENLEPGLVKPPQPAYA
ncbi:MAG: glycerophosphodiester phosphodiesterase family protein [Hyphomonadaceae bacterium]